MESYKYEYKFCDLITNSCKKFEWGNELNILSISFLLNRKIICYNENKRNINLRYIYFIENISKEVILIGLASNHFVPIVNATNVITEQKVNKDLNFLEGQPKIFIKLYN